LQEEKRRNVFQSDVFEIVLGEKQMEQEKKRRKRKEPATTLPEKAKDNIFKTVFGEPRLFVEFLDNFIPIEMLKNIKPEDVEDISERYLPLFTDNKDSDTVKRIKLGGEDLFVVSILEHESEVNYKSSFKMLVYIAYVLDDYVNMNKYERKRSYAVHGILA